MKIKANYTRTLQSDKGYEITFTTTDKQGVQELKTTPLDKVLALEIKGWKETRSKDANAYFHLLVGKIAEALGLGLEEVKKQMVEEYGTELCKARVPQDADIESIYKYVKLIGESKGTKQPCNDWIIFKPTHTLDTKEMARLIDGVVHEAKQLGIETRTPNELAEMMSLWEQGER